jgi:hypothetical protein
LLNKTWSTKNAYHSQTMSAYPWFWPCMSYNLLHLLSTNHKYTLALLKPMLLRTQIIVRSSLKILKNSRRMSPSHLPVKLKFAARFWAFIYSHKIKTFDHVIKYYDTHFRYDIVSSMHLYHLSYVWNLILAYIWDAFGSSSKTGCDNYSCE